MVETPVQKVKVMVKRQTEQKVKGVQRMVKVFSGRERSRKRSHIIK